MCFYMGFYVAEVDYGDLSKYKTREVLSAHLC